MVTGHAFNTLRMIWNNYMPPYMRVGAVRLYTFREFYTRTYLAKAVLNIGRELATRTDMTDQQQREYAQMRDWFAKWDDIDESRVEETKKLGVAPGRLPR